MKVVCVCGTELTGFKVVRLAELTFGAWDSQKENKQHGGVPCVRLLSVVLLIVCVAEGQLVG